MEFIKGTIVQALSTEQGLKAGSTYEVVSASYNRNGFGNYVTYALSRVAEYEPVRVVRNGHLILAEVES